MTGIIRRIQQACALFVLVAIAPAGCRMNCCCSDSAMTSNGASWQPTDLPIDEPEYPGFSLPDNLTFAKVDARLNPQPVAGPRHHLTPEHTRMLAAANAPTAELLESERQVADCTLCTQHVRQQESSRLSRDLMHYYAEEEKNKVAAEALVAFYQLQEVELQFELLERIIEQLQRGRQQAQRIEAQGLTHKIDTVDLQNRQREAMRKQTQLRSDRMQLNLQLRRLLGADPQLDVFYWPEVNLTADFARTDIDWAVQEAMQRHPRLAGMRMAANRVNGNSLGAVTSLLSLVHPGMGAISTARKLAFLNCRAQECEAEMRRNQLFRATEAAEELVRLDVTRRIYQMESVLRAVALRDQTRRAGAQNQRQLREARTAGRASYADLLAADLEQLTHRSDLIHELIAWRIARVRFYEAQGILTAPVDFGSLPRALPPTRAVPRIELPRIQPD